MFELAGFCLSFDFRPGFFDVVAGAVVSGVIVPGAMVSVFGFLVLLCFRVRALPVPAVPNEKDRFSPGTVISVTRSPILRTRSETAGRAGGGLGPGVGGVKSPNIIVAPVYPQVVTAATRPDCVVDPAVNVKLFPVIANVASPVKEASG